MTEQAAPHRHHHIDYLELAVLDVSTAKDFYAAAFGWSFSDYGPEYAGIRDSAIDGGEIGGLRRDETVRPGGPLVLLFSDDLDASVASVVSAGGTIVSDPYEFPGGRRFHFADPSGNELGVWAKQ
jgi:predicted enzyme related to lactoylglutathione lyase